MYLVFIIGVVVGIVVFMFIVVVMVWFCRCWKKCNGIIGISNWMSVFVWKIFFMFIVNLGMDGLCVFIYKEFVVVMKNFVWFEFLGCGGFGSVYKG